MRIYYLKGMYCSVKITFAKCKFTFLSSNLFSMLITKLNSIIVPAQVGCGLKSVPRSYLD